MKRHLLLLMTLLGVNACPTHAWANAGTPLMWAAILHLVFGNALIGFGEGLLLAWLFRIPRGKSVLVMVIANYASAWLGGVFIRGSIVRALPMDLNNAWRWFWVMVAVTYCMTLLLEWPFIAWCFRGAQGWFKRSLQATLVLQTASCLVVFGWYWTASGTTLYTRMNIVAPADLSLPESVLVYFIAPNGSSVFLRHFGGGNEQKICELHSTNDYDRLLVRPSTRDTNTWDLVARLETRDHRKPEFVFVRTNMHVQAAPDWRSTHIDPPQYEGTSFNFGKVQTIGGMTNGHWEFWAGFWPAEGLRASNRKTGERVRFSYETPFGAWPVRNAAQLPSDKVLFQLGDSQICAFDPVTHRGALLGHGRGPVPVIEKATVEHNH
jgi:hypothetical protein